MNLDSLDRACSLLISILLFAALVAATKIGFVIGRRASSEQRESASEVTTIQAAMLGLLALLLGFSFSMAMNRYDIRKRLVVEEANAIGTTYLRARMLPPRHSVPLRKLLRRYVDNRLQFFQAGMDRDRISAVLGQTDRLQEQLWREAMAAVHDDPQPVPAGLFVQSLNEVIDDHAKRVEAFENQVPEAILFGLYVVAIISMGLTGRVCGMTGTRNLMPTLTASLLISLVILMINDLDRPRQGFIKVSQQSMISLRDSLDRQSHNMP